MLNAHFLGPYLKNNLSSLNSYEVIFQLISVIPGRSRTELLADLTGEIRSIKKQLLFKALDASGDKEALDKIMPLFHILIFIVLNFQFHDNSETFRILAEVSHELRLIPLPYGLLPHELIEIIDNERILPGISKIHKLGDDCPLLNHYSFVSIE